MADPAPETDRRGAQPGQMGVQAHVWDERTAFMVISCVANGGLIKDIAWATKLDPKTLRKYYGEELDNGRERAISLIANRLFQDALKPGATKSQELWLKRFGRVADVDRADPKAAPEIPTPSNDDSARQPLQITYIMPTLPRPANR